MFHELKQEKIDKVTTHNGYGNRIEYLPGRATWTETLGREEP